jgi:hypothetical protein
MNRSLKINVWLLAVLLIFSVCVEAKTVTHWKPLPVTKYKSRRVVNLDAKSKVFFYRPMRFEKMPVDVNGLATIQIKTVSKVKDQSVKFTVYVDGKAQDYTVKLNASTNNFSFYESVNIALAKGSKEIAIYTRNPNVYFRAYAKIVKVIKEIPKSVTLKAESYKKISVLTIDKIRKEYYLGDSSNSIKYTAKYNGTVISWFRFLPMANKSAAKIEIYVNNTLRDSYSFSHKISGKYKVNGIKVSVGKKVMIKDIKKNDKIEIRVTSEHEVLNHSYLKTGK